MYTILHRCPPQSSRSPSILKILSPSALGRHSPQKIASPDDRRAGQTLHFTPASPALKAKYKLSRNSNLRQQSLIS